MTREALRPLEGQRVVVSAVRGKITYNSERTSGPKMLLTHVQVHGVKEKFNHMWISVPRNFNSMKNDNIAFTGTVHEYLSMDKEGAHVMKMGIIKPKNMRVGKSRVDAVTKTIDSFKDGLEKQKRMLENKKKREEQNVKD